MTDASLPDWWSYPTHCGNGHAWGPGKVIVAWLPCICGPARAAHARGSGHRTIACRAAGCGYVCFEPPHDPQPGVAPGGHSGDGLNRLPGLGRPRMRWPGHLRRAALCPRSSRPGAPSWALWPGPAPR